MVVFWGGTYLINVVGANHGCVNDIASPRVTVVAIVKGDDVEGYILELGWGVGEIGASKTADIDGLTIQWDGWVAIEGDGLDDCDGLIQREQHDVVGDTHREFGVVGVANETCGQPLLGELERGRFRTIDVDGYVSGPRNQAVCSRQNHAPMDQTPTTIANHVVPHIQIQKESEIRISLFVRRRTTNNARGKTIVVVVHFLQQSIDLTGVLEFFIQISVSLGSLSIGGLKFISIQ